MPHLRLNEKTERPNPNINFITAMAGPRNEESLALLQAIAAQFSSIMAQEQLSVNSFIEVAVNPEFAGRNWNGGEVIEIVLRRRDGSFFPYNWLLHVMAHELAHNRQMNHLTAFQKVNANFLSRVMDLYRNRRTGDGFWSVGRMLLTGRDAAPLVPLDQPEFICAPSARKQKRPRSASSKPRRAKGSIVEGIRASGRQTRIAPKAGGRVNRAGAFPEGSGAQLSTDPEDSSFRRRAHAKSAIAARAEAADRREIARKRDQLIIISDSEGDATDSKVTGSSRMKSEGGKGKGKEAASGSDGLESGSSSDDNDDGYVNYDAATLLEETKFLCGEVAGWRSEEVGLDYDSDIEIITPFR